MEQAKKVQIQKKLFDLPPYGSHACHGIDGDCTIPAIIRHPAEGTFYCAGHAWELAESHPVHMEDIAMAATVRRAFLDMPEACSACEHLAERLCSFCSEPVCFEHMSYVPRTGCACPDCSEQMEIAEAEREERRS